MSRVRFDLKSVEIEAPKDRAAQAALRLSVSNKPTAPTITYGTTTWGFGRATTQVYRTGGEQKANKGEKAAMAARSIFGAGISKRKATKLPHRQKITPPTPARASAIRPGPWNLDTVIDLYDRDSPRTREGSIATCSTVFAQMAKECRDHQQVRFVRIRTVKPGSDGRAHAEAPWILVAMSPAGNGKVKCHVLDSKPDRTRLRRVLIEEALGMAHFDLDDANFYSLQENNENGLAIVTQFVKALHLRSGSDAQVAETFTLWTKQSPAQLEKLAAAGNRTILDEY